jgi:Carboxypeptidase regulatory-like domain
MKTIAFCLLLWVSSGLAWAGTLQGTVKDSGGDPIGGAEIRIEAKKFTKSVKADAKGHYFAVGLATDTTYKIPLIVDGSVKASV